MEIRIGKIFGCKGDCGGRFCNCEDRFALDIDGIGVLEAEKVPDGFDVVKLSRNNMYDLVRHLMKKIEDESGGL